MSATPLSTLSDPCVLIVVIARDAHGLDQPDLQFARHDRGRHQPAARHAHDRLERPGARQPPRERARIAVELVPRDRKCLLCLHLLRAAASAIRASPCPVGTGSKNVLAHVEHEIEAPGERSLVFGGAYQQLPAEQAVLPVARLAGEIELRGQQPAAVRLRPSRGSGACGPG